MASPNFWDNQETAQEVVGQLKSLKGLVTPLEEVLSASEDLSAMLEMADEDDSMLGEVSEEVTRLEAVIEDLELKSALGRST